MPEVHDDSEVVRLIAGSEDREYLVFECNLDTSLGWFIWVAISTPDDITAIFRVDDIAAWSSEYCVPAGTSLQQVTVCASPDSVFARASDDVVGAIFSM